MKRIALVSLAGVLLLPALARADGLATAICVLDTAASEKLIKEYGQIAKIPTNVLIRSSLDHEFFSAKCNLTFKHDGREMKLFASLHDGKVFYAVVVLKDDGSIDSTVDMGLVAHDQIADSQKPRPFVIIARVGNFLKN